MYGKDGSPGEFRLRWVAQNGTVVPPNEYGDSSRADTLYYVQ
jgi:hypothetical protein